MAVGISVVFSQDYANALRVEVKGQATLRLQTDKPAIKMDNQTREVRAVHIRVNPIMIYLLILKTFHSSESPQTVKLQSKNYKSTIKVV